MSKLLLSAMIGYMAGLKHKQLKNQLCLSHLKKQFRKVTRKM